MKKCKFCGQIVDSNATQCTACGAGEFRYVCDNCGNVFEDGVHCPKCGVKVGQKAKDCPKCGNRYYTNACPNCGYSDLNNNAQPAYPERSMPTEAYDAPEDYAPVYNVDNTQQTNKTVMLLLCIFLGFYGVHKFYEGKIGMGVLYLFTGGLFLVGWLIDIYRIATNRPTL